MTFTSMVNWNGRILTLAIRAFVLLALLAAGVAGLSPAGTSAKAPSKFYVDDTGHVLADPFLEGWIATDGLNRLGLPVSEPLKWNGELAQFFQRGVLTKPVGQDDMPQVIATGRELLAARHNPESFISGRRVGSPQSRDAFIPTVPSGDATDASDASAQYSVKGRLKAVYDENGGAERFGAPLSEAYNEFGNRVQWFENGRVASSLPERIATVPPVGTELAHELGVDTTPSTRGSLPSFQPGRYRIFIGDGTVPEANGAFTPSQIRIPSVGIDALIEEVPITDGVMGTPEGVWNVGWYPSISAPGERTNVVMAGHRDWWDVGPVVFWDLDKILPGDMIYLIDETGAGGTYRVTESYSVPGDIDAGAVISDTGEEVLTLITCGGAFDGVEYESRQIIRAVRV